MKGLRIFFFSLLAFLFVSIAETKADVQVNNGFDVIVNVVDFDLQVIDYIIIKANVNYGNYLVINVCRDIIIKNIKQTKFVNYGNSLCLRDEAIKNYSVLETHIINEAFSNPGKSNFDHLNYTNSQNPLNRYKIPFGLRYNYSISLRA